MQSEGFGTINPKDSIVFPGLKGISCLKKEKIIFFIK